jgi:3-deoxy-D-manno-octulosonate 8-phosphate phosphatase (KDO 8-P phosphatase)
MDDLNRRAASIKLLLMDVDGVLTEGTYFQFPGPDGNLVEVKQFDTQDGIALVWMHQYGIKTGLISGRISQSTQERARSGHFSYVYQGHTEKIPMFEEILSDSGLKPEEVAYVGDDLTDVVIMRRVGLAVAVANARPEVKRIAHLVTQASGGRGAIREVAELLFKAQGKWLGLLEHYDALG